MSRTKKLDSPKLKQAESTLMRLSRERQEKQDLLQEIFEAAGVPNSRTDADINARVLTERAVRRIKSLQQALQQALNECHSQPVRPPEPDLSRPAAAFAAVCGILERLHPNNRPRLLRALTILYESEKD